MKETRLNEIRHEKIMKMFARKRTEVSAAFA